MKIKETITKKFNKFLHGFNSELPTTAKDLDKFIESIIKTNDLPNLPSYHRAIATMILHANPQVVKMPKSYFALSVKKAMANEIAFQKIEDLKKEEAEKIKAEKSLEIVSDGKTL